MAAETSSSSLGSVVIKKDRQIGSAGRRQIGSAGGLQRRESQNSLSGFSDGSYEDLEGSVTFDHEAELQLAKDVGSKGKDNSRRVKSASSANASKPDSTSGPLLGSLEDWIQGAAGASPEEADNSQLLLSPPLSSADLSAEFSGSNVPGEDPAYTDKMGAASGGSQELLSMEISDPPRVEVGVAPDYVNGQPQWDQQRPSSRGVDSGGGLMDGSRPMGMMYEDREYEEEEEEEGGTSPDGGGLGGMWEHTMDFGSSMINAMGLMSEDLDDGDGMYGPGMYGQQEPLVHVGRRHLSSIAEEGSEDEGSGTSGPRSPPKSPDRRSFVHIKELEGVDEEALPRDRPLSAGRCEDAASGKWEHRRSLSSTGVGSSTSSIGRIVGEILDDLDGDASFQELQDSAADADADDDDSRQASRRSINCADSTADSCSSVGRAIGELMTDVLDDLSVSGSIPASAESPTRPSRAGRAPVSVASSATSAGRVAGEVLNDVLDDLSAGGSVSLPPSNEQDDPSSPEPPPAAPENHAPDNSAAAATANVVGQDDDVQQPSDDTFQGVSAEAPPEGADSMPRPTEDTATAKALADEVAAMQAALEARLKELEAENERLRSQVLESRTAAVEEVPVVEEAASVPPSKPAAAHSPALVPSLSQTRETQQQRPQPHSLGHPKPGKPKFPLALVASPTPHDSEPPGPDQAAEVLPAQLPVTPMSDRKSSASASVSSRGPRGQGRPPSGTRSSRPGSSSGLKAPHHPPQLFPLASGSWMSGVPGAGGRVYNVTADDYGGETSDPQVWPPPRGGSGSQPSGSAALMDRRSYTGPHVGTLLGSDRRHWDQAPSTSSGAWTQAFKLGEDLIETAEQIYQRNSPPRQPHSAIDAEMQEILGLAWLGTVDDEQGMQLMGPEESIQSQLSEVMSTSRMSTPSKKLRSRSAGNAEPDEEIRRQQSITKWIGKIPKGRRPNPKASKDLTWHFCRPTTASVGAASSVAAPPRAALEGQAKQHYQAKDQMDGKARPSTAPQYALGGGGGDLAAFSRRFFSAESMARRPKSPPRCPSSQIRSRPASKVRRYNSARTSKEGHPGYEVSSRVSQDLQTLLRQPRSSATAMETAMSYMSRQAPSSMWATKVDQGFPHRAGNKKTPPESAQDYRPSSHQEPRRKPLSGRSLLMARPATAGDARATTPTGRGSRSSLGLKGPVDPWKRGPESGAWSGSSRQSIGYMYHRQSGNFSVVPIPEKIGPPIPTVEVDLGYKVAVVPEKAYRNIERILDRVIDRVADIEIPKKARTEAHHAMAELMQRAEAHIDATVLVPGLLNDIVDGAVERIDSKDMAKEVLMAVFENVNRHTLRSDAVKDLLDDSLLVSDDDVPVMKEEEWRALKPSQAVIERVASPWKLKQLRAAEEALRPDSPPAHCGSPKPRNLVSFRAAQGGQDTPISKPQHTVDKPSLGSTRGVVTEAKAQVHESSDPKSNRSWRENRPEPLAVPAEAMPGEKLVHVDAPQPKADQLTAPPVQEPHPMKVPAQEPPQKPEDEPLLTNRASQSSAESLPTEEATVGSMTAMLSADPSVSSAPIIYSELSLQGLQAPSAAPSHPSVSADATAPPIVDSELSLQGFQAPSARPAEDRPPPPAALAHPAAFGPPPVAETSLGSVASVPAFPVAPHPPQEAARASSGRQRPGAARGRNKISRPGPESSAENLHGSTAVDAAAPVKQQHQPPPPPPPVETPDEPPRNTYGAPKTHTSRTPMTHPPKPTPGMQPIQRTGSGQSLNSSPEIPAAPSNPLPSWSSEIRATDSQAPIMRQYAGLQWPESPKMMPSATTAGHQSPAQTASLAGSSSNSIRETLRRPGSPGNSSRSLLSHQPPPPAHHQPPPPAHQSSISTSGEQQQTAMPGRATTGGPYRPQPAAVRPGSPSARPPSPLGAAFPPPPPPVPVQAAVQPVMGSSGSGGSSRSGLTDGYRAAALAREQQQQQQQPGLVLSDYYAAATDQRMSVGLAVLSLSGTTTPTTMSRDGASSAEMAALNTGNSLLNAYAAAANVNMQAGYAAVMQ